MKIKKLTVITLGALSGLASSANAATITGVTIEDVSSELVQSTFDRNANTLLNGAGYQAGTPATHTVVPDLNMWLSQGSFNGGTEDLNPVITFDLEGNYDLSSMTVWNYNEQNLTGRGANAVEVLVASSVGGSYTSIGNLNFDLAPGNNTLSFGSDYALAAAAANNTRLVRFVITSNHGGDNDFIGLSEVRFDGIAVPEPSSIALLGLGSLALVLRRRK